MRARSIATNVVSNWVNLAVLVAAKFVVTPWMVHGLGDELYGLWALMVSVTGYMTVLDVGINTAVIRYVSRLEAQQDRTGSREVFSTTAAIFTGLAALAATLGIAGAPVFVRLFEIPPEASGYAATIFAVLGLDVGLNLLGSVLTATLKARQRFVPLNVVDVTISLIKNVALAVAVLSGQGIPTLAVILISCTALRFAGMQGLLLPDFVFRPREVRRRWVGELVSYSAFSLIISVMLKVIFFTGPFLVARLVGLGQIVVYENTVALLLYAERLIYAAMSVFTPLISANEARGEHDANRQLYLYGTRYTLILIVPLVVVLYTNGTSFIGLWLGPDYGVRAEAVMRPLVIGFAAYLSQLIANSVLKGVSRHRVYAALLVLQGAAYLGLSIAFAERWGLRGVAYGAMIAFVTIHLGCVPWYVCRVIGLSWGRYMVRAYGVSTVLAASLLAVDRVLPVRCASYLQLALYAGGVGLLTGAISWRLVIDPVHRQAIVAALRSAIGSS